ncbi:Hint domain-containing protein [Cognatishimia activa]|uniref:Serralysin C n=1 Tax=Cognatishimia activa TaxID=1715691 RepID=A0A0P1IMT0_9RHOB|nr:Hint domain-containing protein [Cognatishimia activa]CUJ13903.1 Serralysin C precursor [Cognatishimia activa]CUK24977.1 Serralysin C precursor [Cognatishimia activa]
MPTMNSGLGGPAGYGENVYSTSPKAAGNNDDGSIEIDLTSVFGDAGINFFGTYYQSLYLNSNGLITFEGPQTAYTPSGISGLSEPAIAPFWSDVDVNKGGEIYWDIDEESGQITITWDDVAPYRNASTAGTNSFQVVITSTGDGNFTVEYIYENIDWTNGYTGDATVGVTDGGDNDFELEGSGDGSILNTFEGNDFDVGQDDGVWSFGVRDGEPDYRDYVVEGTDSGEVIDASFVDEDGDRVDNADHFDDSNNDEIAAGGGNDSVLAGLGDDTIRGDAGDDTLLGEAGNDILDGGVGDDSLVGGAGNDTFVYQPGDGHDTIADFGTDTAGDNADNIDLSGFYDSMVELRADLDDDGILNQSNSIENGGDVDYSNNDQFSDNDSLTFTNVDRRDFTEDNTGVVCFTKGAMITTSKGDVPIETLHVGDLVQTRDNGLQPILWIGCRRLGRKKLLERPDLKPVRIAPRLIGTSEPLLVSPQHGMLLSVDGEEKLIRAKHLAALDGGQARVAEGQREVVYFHILLEDHQIIFANGAPSESFYPGSQALGSLKTAARREVFTLFPELQNFSAAKGYGTQSRDFMKRKSLPDTLRAFAVAGH